MWNELLTMTVPALVGSVVTFAGVYLSSKNKSKQLDFDIDNAQDEIWLDLVKQSRVEYELQREENNRLRYITHHLQSEIKTLEGRNFELAQEITELKTNNQD